MIWNGCIDARIIPHREQRWKENIGDWWFAKDSTLHVRVSDLGDDGDRRGEWCLIAHETQEAMLCYFGWVKTLAVDRFDAAFEKARKKDDDSEPGDARGAPYGMQHCLATAVERMNVAVLHLNWSEYEESMDRVLDGPLR